MILLTLSRGKGEETVRLQLPASPAEIGETFAFLDRISLDTTATAILDVSSNVPVLYRCLYDVDVEDSEQFQKLQKLAERTEALSPAKAAIFSGALDAECVWNLEGALTVADRLDEYMLVNNVSSDSELGIYLVNKGITPFPDRFKPYINYARVGAEYREKHGGEYSSGNYVQKKTPELLENERLDGVFRIWMENPCPVRVQSETAQITLPATFEQLESARQLLGVDSLNMAKLTRVEALRPYLGEYLPLQGMDLRLEQLDELAENIRIMDQEDGALLKYLSVLEVEQPATLQEALRFSIELDDYERVPDDPEEYGKQVLERIGADEELISSFCKNELTCIHYNGLTHAMIGWNANLYDLNLFAQRLASLTEEQKKGMDALLKIKQNHRVAPIPLNQLINLTYNTDICCFAPRVSNHEELGAFLYANEMLSNEAMALLDTTEEGSGFQERLLELLGEQHQEDHGGVFTDFGYAELGGEIKDIYVCQSNETACFHRSDAPVVLEVRKGFFNDPSYDNDKTAVLNLPAADAGIWRAVEKVDAASVDECAFRCVDCLIPFLRDAINNAIDDEDGIEQADEFAKRLAQIEREWPESDMVKYKALLSVVDHPSLQDATRLMGEIDQYELRPEVAQTWGYAEMMFREKYSALPEELFQTPQAAQIGQKMLDDRLGVITEYGLIRRKDGQPFPVFQPEQEIGQGLEMM